MTNEEFQQLVQRPEGETLDFKEREYELPEQRNALVKDIVAMANTPRDHAAHIVVGVRWTPEGGSTVVGIGAQCDDAVFQNAVGDGRVQPRPRFTYLPFEFEGKQVGVIEVPVSNEGPYTLVRDLDGLQAGAIYYRRGSRNDRAIGSELKRIVNWFAEREGPPKTDIENDAWRRFLESVRRLEPTRRYILVADRIDATLNVSIHALGIVPWRAVIDFDTASDESGLLRAIAGTLGHHRVVHRVTRGEYVVQPEPGIHWFFARGLSGRNDSLSEGDHRSWLRAYKQEISKQLERLAGAISPAPVGVIVLWSSIGLRSHLRTLVEEIHGAFGELAELTIVSDDAASFEAIAEDSGATFIPMSLRSLCAGIAVHYADAQEGDGGRCLLPTSGGSSMEVPTQDRLWLSEDLELVHRALGLRGKDDADDYHRGGEVSWRNLQLRHDCDRDITPPLHAQVEADLRGRQTVRVNLYHAPGAGGTTVGRRVAWDLCGKFPVAVLKHCSSRDTAERIAKVASLTESSVLVVVDGGRHAERDVDELYELLKASQIPAVLLQILRRFPSQKPAKLGGKRQFSLDAPLSDQEADRFRHAYSTSAPHKTQELRELARKRNDVRRNAFFFGLTAFGKDFRGLGLYVERGVSALTDEQSRILVFIAMAHYYGQQTIPAQMFASVLGLPPSVTVDLTAAFCDKAAPALDLLVQSLDGEWRTAHHLIALEIQQQIFVPGNPQERRAVWKNRLSSWGKEFVDFCRGGEHTASDRMLELVRRVFIYRDNAELLGTERADLKRFAQLVEEIPNSHGRIEVLRYLTQRFPSEPHFHAHLGRFLGLNGDFKEAVVSVDLAISLSPGDSVLHHMRGMVLRQSMRAAIDADESMERVIAIAKDATASFEESRRLSSDLAHGYISEVQMLIGLLDYVAKVSGKLVQEVISRPGVDPFLRSALERAEDLLDRVRHLYAGEAPSRYVTDCRARLERIYGDFQSALQAWDSLLARPDVAKPPVRRQIVWTLVRRRKGWDKLTGKEVERVARLLEENLEEEVNDSASLRLWLRVVRQSSTPPTLDSIIERISYWKANTGALDAVYYLYVMHMLRALDGSAQALADADRALEECRAVGRFRRDRTRSFEWIGRGKGIQSLVHQERLGEWEENFWRSTEPLARLDGRIAAIDGPQKGRVEIARGIDAFFVPGKAGVQSSRDENAPVTCYLGFSYDGPRAWDVRLRESVDR